MDEATTLSVNRCRGCVSNVGSKTVDEVTSNCSAKASQDAHWATFRYVMHSGAFKGKLDSPGGRSFSLFNLSESFSFESDIANWFLRAVRSQKLFLLVRFHKSPN